MLERHFHVQPDKFRQVAVSVGVFGPENPAHGEDLAEVGGDGHLLVQLRGLGQIGGPFEVRHLEDVGAALAGATDDFGGVDLGEPFGPQRVAEQLADAGNQPKDGLVGGGPEVQDAVVQARVLVDGDVGAAVFFLVVVCDAPRRVFDLQRQLGLGGRHHPYLLHLKLDVLLGAALDLRRSLFHRGVNVNNAFFRNSARN